MTQEQITEKANQFLDAFDAWEERVAKGKTWQTWTAAVASCPHRPDTRPIAHLPMDEVIGWEHVAAVPEVRAADEVITQTYRRLNSVDEAMRHFSSALGSRYANFDPAKVQKRTGLEALDSFIIGGPVGTGKTTALAYMVDHIAKKNAMAGVNERNGGDWAFYRSATIFSILHNGENKDNKPEQNAMYRTFLEDQNRKYMVIDDYGSEYVEAFALSQFENFVEYRYARNLNILMACNLTKEDFLVRPGFERIADRLLEMCSWVSFTGTSKRRK